MPTSGLRLLMRQGPRAGQTFDLIKPVAVIGREAGNEIVIEDPQVSRHHAKLTLQGASYVVEDLGSTNGTFLDGRRIMTPAPLLIGSKIGLGDTVVLEVQPGGVSEQPVIPPPPAPAYSPAPSYGVPAPPYGSPLPPYGAPPSPPPPVERKGRSCWAWGCGCLVALVVLIVVAAVLFYFFAPPSLTGPIIDLFRQFGIELV